MLYFYTVTHNIIYFVMMYLKGDLMFDVGGVFCDTAPFV